MGDFEISWLWQNLRLILAAPNLNHLCVRSYHRIEEGCSPANLLAEIFIDFA